MARTYVADMEYLGSSELELAVAADDVRGMAVVDLRGLRLGEVEDLVVDARERRVRLLSVASGGILGLDPIKVLIPVEAITKVDHRVHAAPSQQHVRELVDPAVTPQDADEPGPEPQTPTHRPFAAAYGRYDVIPFWEADSNHVYFHAR